LFALYKTSTNTIIQEWNVLPSEIAIPEDNLIVLCPSKDWKHKDYQLIPVTHKNNKPDHKFYKEVGKKHKFIFKNDRTSLEVSTEYTELSLEDVKTKIINTINENINIIINNLKSSVDQILVLEAYEIVNNPVEHYLEDYPLHAPLLGTEGVFSIMDAATKTLQKFKNIRKEIAAHTKDLTDAHEAINKAKTIQEALAVTGE